MMSDPASTPIDSFMSSVSANSLGCFRGTRSGRRVPMLGGGEEILVRLKATLMICILRSQSHLLTKSQITDYESRHTTVGAYLKVVLQFPFEMI